MGEPHHLLNCGHYNQGRESGQTRFSHVLLGVLETAIVLAYNREQHRPSLHQARYQEHPKCNPGNPNKHASYSIAPDLIVRQTITSRATYSTTYSPIDGLIPPVPRVQSTGIAPQPPVHHQPPKTSYNCQHTTNYGSRHIFSIILPCPFASAQRSIALEEHTGLFLTSVPSLV